MHFSNTTLISVCHPKHIKVWEIASRNIVKFINADNYIVVVPGNSIDVFTLHTHPRFSIISENNLLDKFDLDKLLLNINQNRISWYKQQFIKLELLYRLKTHEKAILWDADTIPLKPLRFFTDNGSPIFYSSYEFHYPYFKAIENLLGMKKIISKSFISQCFPVTQEIMNDFFNYVESYNSKSWYEAIIDCIEKKEDSGFSEFETIGTFITHNCTDQLNWNYSLWSRFGFDEIKKVEIDFVNIENNFNLLQKYDYMSFEKWENKIKNKHNLKSKIYKYINVNKIISYCLKYFNNIKKNNIDFLISKTISQENNLLIVQIGANDGVQNDPLRKHLLQKGSYNAILIEPLPFFVDTLKNLYSNRTDIKIIQAAAGKTNEIKTLFYIPNDIALEMNGEGPQNNWALGQGSFSKENVIYWINSNSFRGASYVKKMDYWIKNINEIKVNVIATKELLPSTTDIVLLVIDVQGFELDVLKGIDWQFPPKYIMIEEDLNNREARNYLLSKKYNLISDSSNNLFFTLNEVNKS
jgi:FkbM family methyltransferase